MDNFDADEQPNMFALKEYCLLRPQFCRLLCVPGYVGPSRARFFSQGVLIMRPNCAKMGDALLETIMYQRRSGN